ncbi:PaaX family transcriptional regulator C-terminal domain-containing protein [Citricoccus sp. NPDC055426]|uniref:PaaX family transcriptional regulator n=1 Tax=Citricoccus sp. NPDC055426 TaxID=3155536 RepID=UPI00342D70C6
MSPPDPVRGNLPRYQSGVAPQRMLTVLLGDYWFSRGEPLPSSALVELLGALEITPSSARAAIQRLAQRGFLVAHKDGRRTSYSVHAGNRKYQAQRIERIFQAHRERPWDGTWTIITYRVPETAAPLRRALRDTLRQLRFGHLNDGVWIKPGSHAEEAFTHLKSGNDSVLTLVSFFEGARLPDFVSPLELRRAFDADALDEEYLSFALRWERRARDLGDHWPTGLEALRLRTEVLSEWRPLVHQDPQLPNALLPEEPPLRRAAAAAALFYDRLGPPAENAVRKVVERHQPELAPLVLHHTFAASDQLLAQEEGDNGQPRASSGRRPDLPSA